MHALFQATREAAGEAFLFLDADTALTGDRALARIAARFAALPPHSVLTAVPQFRGGAPLLVSVVPFMLLTNLPIPLATRWGGRLLAAMNGQCWLIAREDYFAHEPHRHHPNEVLEDVRIGQFLAHRGVRPHFADLQAEIEVWMYRDTREAWRFRKNAYLLTGGSLAPFGAFLALFTLTFVVAPLRIPTFLACGRRLEAPLGSLHRNSPLGLRTPLPIRFRCAPGRSVQSDAAQPQPEQ